MIGILLLGGRGSRLKPITDVVNKHFLPVYNKPLFFYSLSILFLLKIKNIILITDKKNKNNFYKLLGNGKKFGVHFTYLIQKKPKGIVDAISLSKKKIKKENFVLMLGDNFFYGNNLFFTFREKIRNLDKSILICKKVSNPENYGVLHKKNNKKYILEKPSKPKSNTVVTGLFFYKNEILKYLTQVKKSKKKEYEISDLNNILFKKKLLNTYDIPRGNVWFDAGTIPDLNNVSRFVELIEKRQDLFVSNLSEISYLNNWISKKQLLNLAINKYEYHYFKYL